jgi:anaerobic magnesium-protoporphyrin IX monomethyl ester cyclase
MIDCLIAVPFEPATSVMLDPHMRSTYLAQIAVPLESANVELEEYLGVDLNYWERGRRPIIGGRELSFPRARSLTAVVLASALEHASLSWRALDPGHQELDWWREALLRKQALQPRTVAVSTTFVLTYPWLRAFFEIVRRALPDSKIIVGGAYYSTNAKKFLSLDADVFCIGEGEIRFPEIARTICANGPLEGIRGLYVRGRKGELLHTGHAEPINLRARPPVDWRLAERIEPSVNPGEELLEAGVETQRGCIFKCEFCTYRTLNTPSALDPKEAADAIMGVATTVGNATINILDATATFPHKRWIAILHELIARGGSPHPIWAFARVADINEQTASLMAAAGVRHLYVGQESGDQRILDAMKKGTKVAQVRVAVEALAKHGIIATFSFIHGFPAETAQSIIATRRMIETLNQGFESNPPVLTYQINPFSIPDFSAVAAREEFRNVGNFFDYQQSDFSADDAFAEVLTTIMAVSRLPFAPAYAHLFFKSVMPTTGSSVFVRSDKIALFRWLKAVERGIGLFLQRSLEGTPIDDAELRRVRDTILAAYPGRQLRPPPFRRYFGRRLLNRLQQEWRAEPLRGPGAVTRAYLGTTVWRQMNDFRMGWHTWRTGEIGGNRLAGLRVPAGDINTFATALIARARATPNKYLKEALPARTGIRAESDV